jgi:predicted RNA binding protein YcfA (HicA-like mRNA interferase family)
VFASAGERMPTKVREMIAALEAHGWRLAVVRGSHRQFRHPAKPGRVTVAGERGLDIPEGTLNSILKQAGLKKEDLK